MSFDSLFDELNKKTVDITKLSRQDRKALFEENKATMNKIDLIWCHDNVACCMAMRAGWRYGINSGGATCERAKANMEHSVIFIDNSFKKYNHTAHLNKIKELYNKGHRPKYITVRDLMTREQCEAAKIEYFSFEQVMEFASEVEPYTQNVIIIPKYDCIDKIPEKYMLGYSIPTKYAETQISIELFKGRKIHLLGGSPNAQINFLNALSKEVVSMDGNALHKLAMKGCIWQQDGKTISLNGYVINGIPLDVTNIMWVCCVISIGTFAKYFEVEAIKELWED